MDADAKMHAGTCKKMFSTMGEATQNASQKDVGFQDACSQDVCPQDASTYDACSQDASLQDVAPALESCTIVAHTHCADTSLGELSLKAPVCASKVLPGQFVHLAMPGLEAHLLRRPFSVYRACAQEGIITLLYQVVGEGTKHIRTLSPGTELDLIGPVGTSWQPGAAKRCLLVGGGVGAAPLYLLAEDLVAQNVSVDMVLGAATAAMLSCERAFIELLSSNEKAQGGEQVNSSKQVYPATDEGEFVPSSELSLGSTHLYTCTDDGSKGFKGFAPARAAELMSTHNYDYIASCGPEPMQKAVAELAASAGVRCQVSLERRMACGIGACLSCVVDTTRGKKRACVDGPVFDAQEVVW